MKPGEIEVHVRVVSDNAADDRPGNAVIESGGALLQLLLGAQLIGVACS